LKHQHTSIGAPTTTVTVVRFGSNCKAPLPRGNDIANRVTFCSFSSSE
jgi:hypothetical protein